MDALTIPRPSPLDKIFRLHVPTYQTQPPSCLVCGAPIESLEAWLDTECPGAAAELREAA